MKLKTFFYSLLILPSFFLFSETSEPCEDWTQTFQIQDFLVSETSKHQNIVVFKNKTIGKVLMLDDIIQFADSDEFIYHETIAHTPLLLHDEPKDILIIGGGDGLITREVLKHPSVRHVTVIEVDGKIVDTCQKHFPQLSQGAFDDPKVRLLIDDGFKFLKKTSSKFDVILVNATDPFGAAKKLFKKQFYELCHYVLKPNGILATQNGSPIIQHSNLVGLKSIRDEIYNSSHFFFCPAPCQLGGIKAFTISFKGKGQIIPSPKELNKRYNQIQGELKYYSPEIHISSFFIPKYLEEKLYQRSQ